MSQMKKFVQKRGKQLLYDPMLNKGTAFSLEERRAFDLTGLLPYKVSTMEEQLERRYLNFHSKRSRIERYEFLVDLQNRNETLFHRLLLEHVDEMMPYIYTPTVGDISTMFSIAYHQSRGVYITYDQKDRIEEVLKESESIDVNVIVASDGGTILGLGDMGVGGMVIPIGKTTLYSAFASLHPQKVLPIFLDLGTDNQTLLDDPLYLGWREKRIQGEKYYEFMDAFVSAVKKTYPNVLLQWEDLSRENVTKVLRRYENKICSFNDDVQGTAAVVFAGLLSAMKLKAEEIRDQKIAIFGGGGAGCGIANFLHHYLVHRTGMNEKEAASRIYIIDRHGLVHEELEHIKPEQEKFAKSKAEITAWKEGKKEFSLAEVIGYAEITTLIGTSAQRGAFDRGIIKTLLQNTSKPVVFPLSNPNSKAEADPSDVIEWSKGSAIVATGSPFEDFEFEGVKHQVPQCNNVYIFPAFGLAVSALKIPKITESMFFAAAETLSNHSLPFLYPTIKKLRDVVKEMAKSIGKVAIDEGLIEPLPDETINHKIESATWYPEYEEYTSV